MVYVLPPDFLLKSCYGSPVDNKIGTVITTQQSVIANCNSQFQLLRDWKAERLKEQDK